MKIPGTNLQPWAKELIDECTASLPSRRQNYQFYRALYYVGATNDNTFVKNNRCFSHIDKMSSHLFSPSDVKFDLSVDNDESGVWSAKTDVAQRFLNRAFYTRRGGIAFAQALDTALMEGCSFVKTTWGREGHEPHIIRPAFMGVLREDIDDLDRQDAFTHTFFLTPAQFRRLTCNHPEQRSLMDRVSTLYSNQSPSSISGDDSYLHEIITGNIAPLGGTQSPGAMGAVNVPPLVPSVHLSPEVESKLIKVTDLWVMDDDREDWTTIRYADPDVIIEGENRHRNLSDVPGEHPFTKVCPNEVTGYFWGRSELAPLANLQELLNARLDDIDRIFKLQANPPRAFLGMSTITAEKRNALLRAGGSFTDDSPNGKVQNEAPDMPAIALEYIRMIDAMFDEAGGLTNIMSGQGESGVRAGVHANTLLRTSSPRIRDRAIIVENQCATLGDTWFKMAQAKDARAFKTAKGEEFMLSQLPDDITTTVDSHTSSPAFSGDNTNLAFALAKAGTIDAEDLLKLTHPPREDELISRLRERKKAEAAFLDKHPELLQKPGARKH